MKKISCVIPCYGSQKTIKSVVDELVKVLENNNQYDYEIVLVNDHSPDQVWDVIEKIVEQNKKVRAISFSQNFGQHAALMAGFSKAKGEYIVSLDDDGQAPIESLFSLIEKIDEGYDVVYGRYPEIKQNKIRIIGSKLNEKMSESLLGKPKDVKGNSFFCMRKYVVDEILNYNNPYPYIEGLILRTTKSIANVTVNQRERLEGQSGYSLSKLIKLWMNGFTAFSVKPLRIATVFGMIFAFAGFIYGIIIIIEKIVNPFIQMGYSSLMATLLFMGGFLMLFMGIIGEYIGRIYISLNNAPQYVINKEIGIDK